ncbi:MAG: heme ABC exporter ATP-binding protein CcmA [Gemmatimonadota bacterium]|nr:heme ABC exporter ATP-binding protein CcmA [Gemmatimonadota bacterium]MDE2983161.1 heme ABC exporter ATP-binding protein CcmA [Gemmatimonadota bacterium]
MTLEGQRLVCTYGPTRALDGVDLVAGGGEIVAVVGPNGAGKTTLLRALSGERRPDRGEVLLDGSPVSGADPGWRGRVGLVSHRTGLYRKLTVAENLTFFASVHAVPEPRSAVARALDTIGAAALADTRVEALSRGQSQRVALARTLLHDPDILFLDEPFTGLDPSAAAALESTLRARRAAGSIIVLVTHDLRRCQGLADRVVVLQRGHKVHDGETGAADAVDLLRFFSPTPADPS